MIQQATTLKEQLRDLKYAQRLDQASLISECTDKNERVVAATAIVRELAMHRVFDQMTREKILSFSIFFPRWLNWRVRVLLLLSGLVLSVIFTTVNPTS